MCSGTKDIFKNTCVQCQSFLLKCGILILRWISGKLKMSKDAVYVNPRLNCELGRMVLATAVAAPCGRCANYSHG